MFFYRERKIKRRKPKNVCECKEREREREVGRKLNRGFLTFFIFPFSFFSFFSLFLIFSCQKESKSKFFISEKGGVVEKDELKIVIPEGALDEPKEIEVKKVKMKGAVGPAFQISPDIKFKIPAEISIKYENNSNINIKTQQKIKEEEFLRIAFYDTNGKTWVPYESYFDGQRVFAKTDHLSTWAIVSDMLFPDPSSSSSSSSSYEPPTGEVPPLKVEEFSVQNFRMSSRFFQKSESELSYEEFSIGNFASILRVDEEGNVWFAEHGFLNQYATYIGKLDTKRGQVKLWWLPAGRWVSDIEVKGRDVWIVLRLGPDLVRFSMDTETFKYFRVPSYIGSWPYEIDFDEEGNIWMTVTVGRAVAKFDVRQESFVFYFRIPVGWWTAGVKVDSNKVWVTETYSCVGPFIYYVNEGRLEQLYPSERFCPGTFYILEGKVVGAMYDGGRLGILDEEGRLDVHGIGLEFSGWMGVRKEDRSVWAGGNNYVFWYSVGERVIKGRANFEIGAGVIAVEVDFEGNAWAILRNVKKVVKIKSKPVVLGCDKTCGEGFEGTPLIQVGSWGSVSANSGKLAVNLASGNLYLPILLIPTFDELSLNFGISYNSLDKDVLGFLGKGWTHSFFAEVEGDESGAYLRFFDGKVIKFSKVGEIYVPESFAGSSFFKALKRNQDGSWILEVRGGGRFEFSREGHILKIKDVKGREWSFEYDDGGRLSEIKDPVGRALRFLWDGMRITAVKDAVGNEWRFFYEGGGEFLGSIRDPEGNFAHFGYSVGRLSEVLDFSGSRWLILYDDKGRVSEVQDPEGRPFRIEYTDNVVRVISRRGFSSEYEIDKNLVAILLLRNEVGAERKYFYDSAGNMIRFIDAKGFEWKYEYENGNLVKVIDPFGNSERWYYYGELVTAYVNKAGKSKMLFYDDMGNLIKKVDFDGRSEWSWEYNNLGLVVKEVQPQGAVIRYEYDSFGNLKRKIDALGNVWRYEHDSLGRLVLEADPLGNTTRYEYDSLGRMKKKVDALGNEWTYIYDSVGNKIAEIDPLGNQTKYFYDFAGNITATVDPLGNISFKEYDSDGNRIRETDFRGNSEYFLYDPAGRLIKHINRLGGQTEIQYDPEGDVVLTVHPSGLRYELGYDKLGRQSVIKTIADSSVIETNNEYDSVGNIVKVKVNGKEARFSYDDLGKVVRWIDPTGREKFYEYDRMERLSKVVEPDGSETQYEYDFEGKLVRILNPDGTFIMHEYDTAGRLVAITDSTGARTEYGYDPVGRIVFIKDPEGGVTRYEYDKVGRVVAVQDPEGNITRFEYDAKGNLVEVIGPDGQRTRYSYDPDGNLISATDPEGNTTFYEYNEMGLLAARIDPDGSRTEYFYDPAGRLQVIKYPNGTTEWFEYDAFGKLIKRVDAEGKFVILVYDDSGNVVKKIYQDGSVELRYNDMGMLVKKIYSDGTEIEFSYDNMGRLIRARGKGVEILNEYDKDKLIRRTFKIPGISPVSVEYGYDLAGRKVLVRDPWGETRYQYNGAGFLKSVESDGIRAFFSYDRSGRRVLIMYPNGVEARYEYGNSNLKSINISKGAKALWNARYTYDKRGLVMEIDELKRRKTYSYDGLGRLVMQEVLNKENPIKSYSFFFGYDSMGNRSFTELVAGVEGIFDPRFPRPKDKEPVLKHPVKVEYRYNKANEILSSEARRTKNNKLWYRTQFSHDMRGNIKIKSVLLLDENSSGNGIYTTRYVYDFDNNLSQILFPGGQREEFLNFEGIVFKERYIDEEDKVKEKNFIYDGDQVLLELDESGRPIKRYVLSDGGEILWAKNFKGEDKEDCEKEGSNGKGKGKDKGGCNNNNNNNKREYIFYHYDHLGSVVILTDFSGEVVGEYEYSPFGEVLEAQGPEAKKNLYLFKGRRYIEKAGVYDFRLGIWDPRYGRFLQGAVGMGKLVEQMGLEKGPFPHVFPPGTEPRTFSPFVGGQGFTLGTFQGRINIQNCKTQHESKIRNNISILRNRIESTNCVGEPLKSVILDYLSGGKTTVQIINFQLDLKNYDRVIFNRGGIRLNSRWLHGATLYGARKEVRIGIYNIKSLPSFTQRIEVKPQIGIRPNQNRIINISYSVVPRVNIPKIRDGDVLLWMPAMRPDRWSTTNLAQVTIPSRWMTIICDYEAGGCGKAEHVEGTGPDPIAEIWLHKSAVEELKGRFGQYLCAPAPPIASTILHELVHEACYSSDDQEKGMAYGCEYSCFGGKDTEGSKRCRQGR